MLFIRAQKGVKELKNPKFEQDKEYIKRCLRIR